MTATLLLTILLQLLMASTFAREALSPKRLSAERLRASLLALLFSSVAGLLLWLLVTDVETAIDF